MQIASALGFKNPSADVQNLYQRNADEFTDSMTALVKLPTAGGEQETRIFSLRGCHLLAMLSRTRIAKEFRRWVLDLLDRETAAPALPPSGKPGTRMLICLEEGGRYSVSPLALTAVVVVDLGDLIRIDEAMDAWREFAKKMELGFWRKGMAAKG